MRHANKEHANSLSHNEHLGVWITNHVGTMVCAYVFAIIGVGSLIGVITGNATLALLCGATSSYVLQLVLLPIIMVGTNVQSKHDAIVSDIRYQVDILNEEALKRIEDALKEISTHLPKGVA